MTQKNLFSEHNILKTPELALIMPVYNEEDAISHVIDDWMNVLFDLKVNFKFHVYNDGSKDSSLHYLNKLALKYPDLIVHDKKNSGHGPTILKGYRENINAKWLFQIDSDDEMPSIHFQHLWKNKDDYDILIGARARRNSTFSRRFITLISRFVVKVFYKSKITDVNAPYRLIRSSSIKKYIHSIPENTFAPNLIITGLTGILNLKTFELDVPHQNRRTGVVSIKKFKLFKAALKSMVQVINYRINLLNTNPDLDRDKEINYVN